MKAHHTYHLATGEAYQFFMNLPFGETMIEQGGYDYDNPYKFNDYGSKKIKYLFTKRIQRSYELDVETGLYYYGARYGACPERSRGNPKISMWSSVDPLAEKYPSFNPYNYVLNNPVVLTDPDGKRFLYFSDYMIANAFRAFLKQRSAFYLKRAEKFYSKYNKLLSKGKIRRAQKKFSKFKRTTKGLVEINKAINELNDIENAKDVFTFNEISGNSGKTKFSKQLRAVVITYNGYALLGHELKHAFQGLIGKLNIYNTNNSYDKQDEIEAYTRQYYLNSSSLPISVSSASDIGINYINRIVNSKGDNIYQRLPSTQNLMLGGLHKPNLMSFELPTFHIEPTKATLKR